MFKLKNIIYKLHETFYNFVVKCIIQLFCNLLHIQFKSTNKYRSDYYHLIVPLKAQQLAIFSYCRYQKY